MTKKHKETLMKLSKEQLIYLIAQMEHSMFMISEVCVDESKWHITSENAVNKIRKYIYHMPSLHDAEGTKNFIDMKMGKIGLMEYRVALGLEDGEIEYKSIDEKIKQLKNDVIDLKRYELPRMYHYNDVNKIIDEAKMEAVNDTVDDVLYIINDVFKDDIYDEEK